MSDPERKLERTQYLDDHKRHLRETSLKIVLSGPVFDAGGDQVGGMVVAEVDDLDDLRRFSDDDPFVVHKVYVDIKVCQWAATIDNR
jgi:hypothetical protein